MKKIIILIKNIHFQNQQEIEILNEKVNYTDKIKIFSQQQKDSLIYLVK
jgi:hypothetical protein